jgi:O-antigen/teichoic acid export membrane protein
MNEEHLKARMVRGVSWTAVSQVSTQLVTFVTTVILARLLAPADFGLVGMAALFGGLVMVLGQIGMGAALIHRQQVEQADLETVFWAGLAVAITVTGLSFVLAPLGGWFFHNPAVVAIIRVWSLAYVIDALGSVHRVLMNKEMEFDRLAKTEVGAAAAYASAAVVLALTGAGVWAIVIGQLVRSTVEVALLWRVEHWRPRRRFSKEAFTGLFGFSARVWAFSFVDYARENVDNLAVGRLLGETQLGFYAFAYNAANLPRRQLQNIVGRVTFPAFAKSQDDNPLLRRTYLKIIRYISLFAFPLLAGLALVAPQFVPLLYGDKWLPSVVPLQLLCGAQMLYSLGCTVGSIYLAKGRPDLHLRFGLIALVWITIVVLIAARFGIVAVAAGILFYTVGSLLVGQALANPLIELRMRDYLKALVPAAVGCVAMAVAILSFRYLVLEPGYLHPLPWLILAIALGAVVYVSTIALFRTPEIDEVLGVLRRRGRQLRSRVSTIGRRVPAVPITEPLVDDVPRVNT